tara:strand:+ start:470 stop:1150 length:681 start_codon:yes stop_codon:yes gene_type:complete
MYKAVLFDAYGTLLDVDSAAANLAATNRFPELAALWPELSALWRSCQLNYTWLRSLSNSYAPFWQITCDALDYAMEAYDLEDQGMRTALLNLYRELDAYADARPALDAVHAAGLPAAVLSNGDQQMIDHAFAAAGLTDRLDSLLSVDDVNVFKPEPRVYQLGCNRYQSRPEEILFVSSNGWDAAAAGLFGFKTIWANRAGRPVERLPRHPDFISSGLDFVEKHLSS